MTGISDLNETDVRRSGGAGARGPLSKIQSPRNVSSVLIPSRFPVEAGAADWPFPIINHEDFP